MSQAEACRSEAIDRIPDNRTEGGAWAPKVHPLLGYDSRWPLPNVWHGVSAEDQQRADERIPHLLQTPAAVRFVSAEPLLGPVDLRVVPIPTQGPRETAIRRLDWVIVSGESGPAARPCDLGWIRSIVEQCRAASVPVFVKQLGARPIGVRDELRRAKGLARIFYDAKGGDPAEWPSDLRVREVPA